MKRRSFNRLLGADTVGALIGWDLSDAQHQQELAAEYDPCYGFNLCLGSGAEGMKDSNLSLFPKLQFLTINSHHE